MITRLRKFRCRFFGHKPAPATVYRSWRYHEITRFIRYCSRCGDDMSFVVPSRFAGSPEDY